MADYPDLLDHPQFAFCQPTADSDVAWFYLQSTQNIWHTIQFDYLGMVPKVDIQYQIADSKITIRIEMPAEVPSDGQTPEEMEDIAWQRLSFWLANPKDAENYATKPQESLKYNLWEKFDKTFILDYSEGMLLGFYTNFWDE